MSRRFPSAQLVAAVIIGIIVAIVILIFVPGTLAMNGLLAMLAPDEHR
jgi:hypothetical protein